MKFDLVDLGAVSEETRVFLPFVDEEDDLPGHDIHQHEDAYRI